MTGSGGRFDAAIAAIDAANADDPNVLVVDGVERPKEQVHAELMTDWVARLDPQAGDAQLLAARAHHLRRWAVPRTSYPTGRAGYLRWRSARKKQHAEDVGRILDACGYERGMVERVGRIVRKEGLGTDADVQTHEDALCLTFLQTQFDALAAQLGAEKTADVVRKTLAKMSEHGRAVALGLELDPELRALVEQALEPQQPGGDDR